MKLAEALGIVQKLSGDATPYPVVLACGFTPLHLQTFLTAHLQRTLPSRRVQVTTGLYGDLAGTMESVRNAGVQAVAVVLEWPDLDPRLGFRHVGTRGPSDIADIAGHVQQSTQRIYEAIQYIPPATKVAVSLPTLPLPPIFSTASWQASEYELVLRQAVAGLAVCAAHLPNVAIIHSGNLSAQSTTAYDFKADLLTGFPYTLTHADAVGAALARLIAPAAVKKGLITDLDDTLWKGIVGEIGHEAIGWDLTTHSQIHGLYQQLLASLADEGVLIGIASKNDPEVTRKALARNDMLLPSDKVFPVEVHWNSKSGSVERILKAWNIGPDSVVFVDDSPMELAEVQAAHPSIECLLFPKSDYTAAYAFLHRVRNLFGKARVSDEDRLRLESIRQNTAFQEIVEKDGSAPDAFLAQMNANITLDFRPGDPRVLELVNKTNQFNLNGVRYTESDWQDRLNSAGAFVISITYDDKFGRLGKISAIEGRQEQRTLTVNTWVMSCRAFARRIEHQCLQVLFRRFQVDKIHFRFSPTAKNGPLREFFRGILDEVPDGPFTVSRTQWESKCPALYHQLSETNG